MPSSASTTSARDRTVVLVLADKWLEWLEREMARMARTG